jgi:seryl-tRNA synthetase
LRSSVIVLIVVLSMGSVVISLGFLTSPEYLDIPEISNQYEKLETYKNELEKLNQRNQQVLHNLEQQIQSSDDVPLGEIYEEIETIKQVIDENKVELERVITKLSQIESDP